MESSRSSNPCYRVLLLAGTVLALSSISGCAARETIDFNDITAALPENLSSAVQSSLGAVVLDEVTTKTAGEEHESGGTAVHIGGGAMLTARHIIETFYSPDTTCGDIWISATTGTDQRLLQDKTDKTDTMSVPTDSVYDLAMVRFSTDSQVAHLPRAKVAKSSVLPSSTILYTVGYPLPRDPRAESATKRVPAKMAVVILGKDPLQSNSILAFTGIRSFEHPPADKEGGPGLSGAPVFNTQGEIAATITGDTSMSVKEAGRLTGIAIDNAPHQAKVVQITPVSSDGVQKLSHTQPIRPC
jgi:hypothetical protein